MRNGKNTVRNTCTLVHIVIYIETNIYVCHIWTKTNKTLSVNSYEKMQRDYFYIAAGDLMIVYVYLMKSQRHNYSRCLTDGINHRKVLIYEYTWFHVQSKKKIYIYLYTSTVYIL
jgi:hypothetical protein